MLNFEQIDFKKDARILNYLNNQDFRICDYTPLTILCGKISLIVVMQLR